MSAQKKPHRPFKRFMRYLAIMMGCYFAITAILSLTVDPWRINNTRLSIKSLDSSREISGTVRVGKAALANRGNWEAIMLGSSRIEMGLNPSHPAFEGKRTVNLAMSAATLNESIPVGNYTLDRNPSIRRIIFGIEAGEFFNDLDSRKYAGSFEASPFADNNRSIERGINQVIGSRSLFDSIATIQRYLKGTGPERSPLGQWVKPNHPANLRTFVEDSFQFCYVNNEDAWAFRPQKLRQKKADLLTGFIQRCRDSGIQLYIVVSPQHALMQIHPTLDEPKTMWWEHDLSALVDICKKANSVQSSGPHVKLWSFLTFNEFTNRSMPAIGAESQQMSGWFNLGHAKPELGDKMIETVISGEPAKDPNGTPYGVNLLDEDFKEIRLNWIAAHYAYCKTHPNDVKWWRSIVASAGTGNPPPSVSGESPK